MTDQTDPPVYSNALEDRPDDLEWARRVAWNLDVEEPREGYNGDYETTVPTRRLRSLLKTITDQATELESLRDRGDQVGSPGVLIVPDPEAVRIIATAEEAGQLPTGSIIVDDSGRGPAWIIDEDGVTESWYPQFVGRRVHGLAGFGGVRYSVVYPAVLIHTPKEPTA